MKKISHCHPGAGRDPISQHSRLWRHKIPAFAGMTCCILLLCGFSKEQAPPQAIVQPQDERKAQEALPKSRDPMWTLLAKTKIHWDAKSGFYSATFPDEVKALVGKEITIG